MGDFLLGPPGLILLAAILGAVGALWASHQQTEFERKLGAKNEEIAKLTKETLDSVTGGDSFAYLGITGLSDEDGSGRLFLIHQGEHPLFDVGIRIVDLEKFDAYEGHPPSFEILQETDTYRSVSAVAAGYSADLGPFQIGTGDTRRFNVFFVARNGGFTQLIRYRRVEGQWRWATKVMRDSTHEVLLEKVEPKYPRNAVGEVDWGERQISPAPKPPGEGSS